MNCPNNAESAISTPVTVQRKPPAAWPLYLLLVLFLLGIPLLAILPVPLTSDIERSKIGAACGDIGAFNSALALYQVDVSDSQFPRTTLNQLVADTVLGWNGPYIATITSDPWNNNYAYTSDGSNYTVMSVHKGDRYGSETIRYVFAQGTTEQLPPLGYRAGKSYFTIGLLLILLVLMLVRICLMRIKHPVIQWLNIALAIVLWVFVVIAIYRCLTIMI